MSQVNGKNTKKKETEVNGEKKNFNFLKTTKYFPK